VGAVETALPRAATAVVKPGLSWWLGRRRAGRLEIVDAVYERLRPLVEGQFARLPQQEVAAAFDAVADTFAAAAASPTWRRRWRKPVGMRR